MDTITVTASPATGPERPRSNNASRFTGGSADLITAPKVGRKEGIPGMKYGQDDAILWYHAATLCPSSCTPMIPTSEAVYVRAMNVPSEKLTTPDRGFWIESARYTPSINTVMIVASSSIAGVRSLCLGYGGFLNTSRSKPLSVLRSKALSPVERSSVVNETKADLVSLWFSDRKNSRLSRSPRYSCSTLNRCLTRSMIRCISSCDLV